MFRQRSGSSLCYACGKLNRVDASVCFYCGRRNPGLWGFGAGIGRLVGGLDFAGLVTAVAVIAYIASLALDPRAALSPRGVFDLLAPSGRALYALGMAGAIPWQQGHWWSVLTAIYLHGSLLHILFNLLWVRQLVPDVEQAYGRARTIMIFTLSGVVCFLLSDFVGTSFTVGASGAILKAGGPALVLPEPASGSLFFEQDTSVVVQMLNSVNACWTTEFQVPDTKKNTAAGFKAVFKR